MFNKLRQVLLIGLLVILLCFGTSFVSFLAGRFFDKQSEIQTVEVNSTVILEKIKNNYFVVTKTVFTNQDTTIDIGENSNWNNLLWGHSIKAEGTMRVDVGVDMNKLAETDIKIDKVNMKVIINLPNAEILNTSLFGDMEIETKSGILKQLFENDKSADFNLALEQLKNKAEGAIDENPVIYEEARMDSIRLVSLIVSNLGYQVEAI